MFNQVKAAQAAALIMSRVGPTVEVLKLMKLLYLTDRESYAQRSISITGDRMVSMPHGPVLSQTYDLMNGMGAPVDGGWAYWISGRAGYRLSLIRPAESDELDCLSADDVDILSRVCAQFGHMSSFELRDFTHDQCAEWENPNGSSRPISTDRLFVALGFDEAQVKARSARQAADEEIDALFASL